LAPVRAHVEKSRLAQPHHRGCLAAAVFCPLTGWLLSSLIAALADEPFVGIVARQPRSPPVSKRMISAASTDEMPASALGTHPHRRIVCLGRSIGAHAAACFCDEARALAAAASGSALALAATATVLNAKTASAVRMWKT
jgi:hypothetical protein